MRFHSSIPLLRIVPDDTKFDFMRFRRISFPISALLSLVAILLFFHPGLNLGIDFRGGSIIEIQAKGDAADAGDVRSRLNELNLGDVQVQEFGSNRNLLIRIEAQQGGDNAEQSAVRRRQAGSRDRAGGTCDRRRHDAWNPGFEAHLFMRRRAVNRTQPAEGIWPAHTCAAIISLLVW